MGYADRSDSALNRARCSQSSNSIAKCRCAWPQLQDDPSVDGEPPRRNRAGFATGERNIPGNGCVIGYLALSNPEACLESQIRPISVPCDHFGTGNCGTARTLSKLQRGRSESRVS